ncbi:MAG: hypothetical protein M0Z52_07270 [Actinomycetota bacterium]|nr:hypothetical protein [Actinomycetota bacterium]
MTWKDIGQTLIGQGLPLLGNVLLPGVGGTAGTLVAKALGCTPDPEAVSKALASADPATYAKLKELEDQHQEALINLGIESDKAYLADVQNARQRETDIVTKTGKKDWNLYLLAWTVIVGFFLLVWEMTFASIPSANLGPVNQLYGAMAVGFGTVLAYFFGSSKESSDKNQMLYNSVPAASSNTVQGKS